MRAQLLSCPGAACHCRAQQRDYGYHLLVLLTGAGRALKTVRPKIAVRNVSSVSTGPSLKPDCSVNTPLTVFIPVHAAYSTDLGWSRGRSLPLEKKHCRVGEALAGTPQTSALPSSGPLGGLQPSEDRAEACRATCPREGI